MMFEVEFGREIKEIVKLVIEVDDKIGVEGLKEFMSQDNTVFWDAMNHLRDLEVDDFILDWKRYDPIEKSWTKSGKPHWYVGNCASDPKNAESSDFKGKIVTGRIGDNGKIDLRDLRIGGS